MSSKPVLYSYYRSSCSWRVRIALAFKDIEYDYKPVNLLKSEQLSDEYTSVNPMGVVPALKLEDGNVITQSLAIIEYLEEAYPDKPSLLPKDHIDRAKVRAISQDIVAGIQPLQNFKVLKKLGGAATKEAQEWGHHWIDLGFKALEKTISKTAGKYCYGDEVSMADVCLVPQIFNANRLDGLLADEKGRKSGIPPFFGGFKKFKVSLDAYPTIKKVYENLKTQEAFRKSHPNEMIDCPEDQKVPV